MHKSLRHIWKRSNIYVTGISERKENEIQEILELNG